MWNGVQYYQAEAEKDGETSQYPSSFPESHETGIEEADFNNIRLSFPPPEDDLAMVDSEDESEDPQGLVVLKKRRRFWIKVTIVFILAVVAFGVVIAAVVPRNEGRTVAATIQGVSDDFLGGDPTPSSAPVALTSVPTMELALATSSVQIVFRNVSEVMEADEELLWVNSTESFLESFLNSPQVIIEVEDQSLLSTPSPARRLQTETSVLIDFNVTSLARGQETLGEAIVAGVATSSYLDLLQEEIDYFEDVTSLQARVAETFAPTTSPTVRITESPTEAPSSSSPTLSPVTSTAPSSSSPTLSPVTSTVATSGKPTLLPTTLSPTLAPVDPPTKQPIAMPTLAPATSSPVESPTARPVQSPTTTPTGSPMASDRVCNGIQGLCDFPVNDIMFAKTHNSVSTEADNYIFANHQFSVEDSLVAGVRSLSVDVGRCFGQVVLFHSQCFLGSTSVVSTFQSINYFLTLNPDEVVVISLQMEGVGVQELHRVLETVQKANEDDVNEPRFVDRLYQHTEGVAWPTLSELIDAKTNVILFHYNGPLCSEVACPRGYMDYFRYTVETPFEFQNEQELADTQESCRLDRGRNSGSRDFYGVNLFLQIPNEAATERINSLDNVDKHISACESLTSLEANFIIHDFWKKGDVVNFVQFRNDLLVSSV